MIIYDDLTQQSRMVFTTVTEVEHQRSLS